MDLPMTLKAIGVLAAAVRQIVESIKTVVPYSTLSYQKYIDLGLVAALSVAACMVGGINLAPFLGLFTLPQWAGTLLTGLAATLPSTLFNDIITWVENLKANTAPE